MRSEQQMGKGCNAMRRRREWRQEGEVKLSAMPPWEQATTPLHIRQYTPMRVRQVLKLGSASALTITLLT